MHAMGCCDCVARRPVYIRYTRDNREVTRRRVLLADFFIFSSLLLHVSRGDNAVFGILPVCVIGVYIYIYSLYRHSVLYCLVLRARAAGIIFDNRATIKIIILCYVFSLIKGFKKSV